MPIAALVVTFDEDPELRLEATQNLRVRPELTLGQEVDRRLPVVADTATPEEGEDVVRELQALPGIAVVHVVGVDFSLDEAV